MMNFHTESHSVDIDLAILPEAFDIAVSESMTDAQANIDMDMTIAKEVAAGHRPATIRLWRHHADVGIVVSRKDIAGPLGQRAIDNMTREGYQVFVRHTGGTAVPHCRGVLNLSMIFPRTKDSGTTDAYYRLLCKPQIDWLRTYGIEATTGEVPGSYCDGKYNVIADGLKLVGTAQSWRGGLAGIESRHPGYILAHACMMVDVDLTFATRLINQFYTWIGDEYRVDEATSTTIGQLVQAKQGGPRMSSEQALDAFSTFLVPYFANYGVKTSYH